MRITLTFFNAHAEAIQLRSEELPFHFSMRSHFIGQILVNKTNIGVSKVTISTPESRFCMNLNIIHAKNSEISDFGMIDARYMSK